MASFFVETDLTSALNEDHSVAGLGDFRRYRCRNPRNNCPIHKPGIRREVSQRISFSVRLLILLSGYVHSLPPGTHGTELFRRQNAQLYLSMVLAYSVEPVPGRFPARGSRFFRSFSLDNPLRYSKHPSVPGRFRRGAHIGVPKVGRGHFVAAQGLRKIRDTTPMR